MQQLIILKRIVRSILTKNPTNAIKQTKGLEEVDEARGLIRAPPPVSVVYEL